MGNLLFVTGRSQFPSTQVIHLNFKFIQPAHACQHQTVAKNICIVEGTDEEFLKKDTFCLMHLPMLALTSLIAVVNTFAARTPSKLIRATQTKLASLFPLINIQAVVEGRGILIKKVTSS